MGKRSIFTTLRDTFRRSFLLVFLPSPCANSRDFSTILNARIQRRVATFVRNHPRDAAARRIFLTEARGKIEPQRKNRRREGSIARVNTFAANLIFSQRVTATRVSADDKPLVHGVIKPLISPRFDLRTDLSSLRVFLANCGIEISILRSMRSLRVLLHTNFSLKVGSTVNFELSELLSAN